jgi:hypothetical protein
MRIFWHTHISYITYAFQNYFFLITALIYAQKWNSGAFLTLSSVTEISFQSVMEHKLKTINYFNNNHAPMNMEHLKIPLTTRTQYQNKHNSFSAAVTVHIT